MKVIVPYVPVVSKGGTALMAGSLRLTGFGEDKSSALEELERGVRAWCRVLAKRGILESALAKAGLALEQDGKEDLRVLLKKIV